MRARWMRVFGVLLALLIVGAPVAAEDFTGYEEDEQTLACPGPGESVPENQEPPGEGECVDADNPDETYQGKVWDNDVTCADGGQDLQVAKLYTTGDPAALSGGAGICNDGSTVPVQGRAVVSGSQEQEGLTIYVDGDKDNTPAPAQGYARADIGTSGAVIICGEDGGKLDASSPSGGDAQDDCG